MVRMTRAMELSLIELGLKRELWGYKIFQRLQAKHRQTAKNRMFNYFGVSQASVYQALVTLKDMKLVSSKTISPKQGQEVEMYRLTEKGRKWLDRLHEAKRLEVSDIVAPGLA